jgi:hypothetical protein
LLSGVAVDAFTTYEGGNAIRNWKGFWITSSTGALVIFLLVAAVFKSKGKIQTQQEVAVAGD